MVPVRDHVCAGALELPRDLGGETRTARGVLTVHDREVDAVLVT
jgi:hypothetical protein